MPERNAKWQKMLKVLEPGRGSADVAEEPLSSYPSFYPGGNRLGWVGQAQTALHWSLDAALAGLPRAGSLSTRVMISSAQGVGALQSTDGVLVQCIT